MLALDRLSDVFGGAVSETAVALLMLVSSSLSLIYGAGADAHPLSQDPG